MDVAEEFEREVAVGAGAALDRLALLIALRGTGSVDVVADLDIELARLDRLADDFAGGVGGGTAGELMGWLGIRGFRGNVENYYDPDNSFLNRVVDTGLGIPISLSVIAIEVGRRCGIELVGVGLPGEFIVCERDDPDSFHNPFRHTSMTIAEVTTMVRRFAGPGASVTPEMRVPVHPIGIAARMLTNLAHIYSHTDQPVDLEWVLRLQSTLPGTHPGIRRHHVATLYQLGRFWDASEVLGRLMADPSVTPSADEHEADEAMLKQLRAHFN